jgi:hypothetical protein
VVELTHEEIRPRPKPFVDFGPELNGTTLRNM